MDCKTKDNCQTDLGRGCTFCGCGEELQGGACEGCYKLHSYDWLEDMPVQGESDIFEIRFKNTRKGFYKNVNSLPLAKGDIVAVEASPGHDIGIISLTGDMVARQMRRVGFNPQNGEFKKIYRKAKPYDIEKWQEAIALEHETMIRSRQIAADMGLNMKIGDVEYQGDRIKAIFYYIADERVDFRELIKVFADQFRIRVEMKQIGARQEAGRIGGLGSCGRELCCASWISGFASVTTNAARHQEISLNPQKLAGQCGKLKCCLVYELDTYMDARRDFPRVNSPLQAMDGEYFHIKSDILGRTMSFSSAPGEMANMITLPVERVREILDLNRKGTKVDRIQDYDLKAEVVEEPDFLNVVGEDSITRFDKQREQGRSRRGGRNRGHGEGGQNAGGREGREGREPRNGNGGNGGGGNNGGNANQQRREQRPQGDRNNRGQGEGRGQRNDNRPEGQRRGDGQNRPEGQNRPDGQNRPEGQNRNNDRNRNRGRGNGGGNRTGRNNGNGSNNGNSGNDRNSGGNNGNGNQGGNNGGQSGGGQNGQ